LSATGGTVSDVTVDGRRLPRSPVHDGRDVVVRRDRRLVIPTARWSISSLLVAEVLVVLVVVEVAQES
jgi:hypothetical protein